MPCTDKNGKQWNTGDIICEGNVQKQCGADGVWIPTGLPCDGSEKNAPKSPLDASAGNSSNGG